MTFDLATLYNVFTWGPPMNLVMSETADLPPKSKTVANKVLISSDHRLPKVSACDNIFSYINQITRMEVYCIEHTTH